MYGSFFRGQGVGFHGATVALGVLMALWVSGFWGSAGLVGFRVLRVCGFVLQGLGFLEICGLRL